MDSKDWKVTRTQKDASPQASNLNMFLSSGHFLMYKVIHFLAGIAQYNW